MSFKKIITRKIGADGVLNYTVTSTLKTPNEQRFTREVAKEYLDTVAGEIEDGEFALLEADRRGYLFTKADLSN